MAEGDTLLNAFMGAAVTIGTIVFVLVPPIVGGALRGYLHGGTRGDGLGSACIQAL